MRRAVTVLLSSLALAAPAVAAAPSAVAAAPEAAAAKTPAAQAATPMARTAPGALTDTCGAGYVCIYKGDIWDGGSNHPMVYRFYRYGTYNVSNLVGDYTVKNCQTGGAGVKGFTGSNGTGSTAWNIDIDNCTTGLWTSLTSTYSVKLYP